MIKGFALILTTFFMFQTIAAEMAKVTIPDKKTVAKKELLLNGIGIRRGTFLNVKVYVGGLYVPKKSQNAQEILDMPNPKHISMNFLRDVPKKETRDAWKEGFIAAIPEAKRKGLMKYLEALNQKMPDLNKKEVMQINFLDSGVEVIINDKKVAKIGNKEFSDALFSIWFVEPRDARLMNELLGVR